jgi:glucose/arabinose dehydrogenase
VFGRLAAIIAGILLIIGAFFWFANPQGWRTRITTRLWRSSNYAQVVTPPAGFLPHVPDGFKVNLFASGFQQPRWLAVAPDGAIFVADSAAGQIVVLHADGATRDIFADKLSLPFGIAFLNSYVYVANTDEVVRFRFDPMTSKRLGNAEHVMDLPGFGYNQHWTRSLAFNAEGTRLFVSVGSETNISVETDPRRAAILSVEPDGANIRIYSTGLRNAVGLAVCPATSQLWASVNERDNLGDDIPSDYLTHVIDGGFYGWPYSYLGSHIDDRVESRPDLVAAAIPPDVELGAHVAPLQFAFYEGSMFPAAYKHGVFLAEHGSWNRAIRSGNAVVFVPFREGKPVGSPQPFLTGFVPDPRRAEVYGRPVGVAVTRDGALLVSDDGGNVIWKVSYSR